MLTRKSEAGALQKRAFILKRSCTPKSYTTLNLGVGRGWGVAWRSKTRTIKRSVIFGNTGTGNKCRAVKCRAVKWLPEMQLAIEPPLGRIVFLAEICFAHGSVTVRMLSLSHVVRCELLWLLKGWRDWVVWLRSGTLNLLIVSASRPAAPLLF